jgi:hypothetical protein
MPATSGKAGRFLHGLKGPEDSGCGEVELRFRRIISVAATYGFHSLPLHVDDFGIGWKRRRLAFEISVEKPYQTGVDCNSGGPTGGSHFYRPGTV